MNMKKSRVGGNRGVTLIETLVYLALFGILMSGGIVAAYNIFQSSDRNSAKILIEEEGDFLLGKINWSLSAISAINSPASGSSGSELLVTSTTTGVGTIDIKPDTSLKNITMTRAGVTQTLNNSNTVVSNILFDHETSAGVEWITSSFILNTRTADGEAMSQQFQTTKYVRK